jgi:colanic acid/amylovoran biosynthesis protein
MHSNIFAMTENVPFIAIGYLHKTLGIARTASLEDWVVNIQQVDNHQLIAKLDQLWIERDHVHSQLLKKMPEMSEKVHKAGLLIAQDYASLTKGKIHA